MRRLVSIKMAVFVAIFLGGLFTVTFRALSRKVVLIVESLEHDKEGNLSVSLVLSNAQSSSIKLATDSTGQPFVAILKDYGAGMTNISKRTASALSILPGRNSIRFKCNLPCDGEATYLGVSTYTVDPSRAAWNTIVARVMGSSSEESRDIMVEINPCNRGSVDSNGR